MESWVKWIGKEVKVYLKNYDKIEGVLLDVEERGIFLKTTPIYFIPFFAIQAIQKGD